MAVVSANGIDLYYEEYGEGAAILGIHGTPSSAALWVDAARTLADHGRCVIYDRRGFARSRRPDPVPAVDLRDGVDLSDHVADAAALLSALSATPAIVIGRSTGGLIALELARRHAESVAALVLLEPAMFTVDSEAAEWAKQLRMRALQVVGDSPDRASEIVIREALGDETWESLPESLKEMFIEVSPAVLDEIRGSGLDLSEAPLHLTSAELAGIGHPTLVVSAEDSPLPLRRVVDHLADALPQAQRAHVTGGHLISPADNAVLDFIDAIG